jgi:large subunit ribosomal protein L24
MVARIKKNDKVCVVSGKDRGKEGVVLAVSPRSNKVMIKGVAIVTRHVKASREEAGGIKKSESFITMSKVMPVCSSCNKACRVNAKSLDSGVVARVCNRCKETF